MNGSAAIDWGHAALVMPGQTRSGDRCVIAIADGTALIAVIDGIGHGEEAAAAANAAALVLETSPNESLRTLFDRCHAQLRATRGAAMTVARFESHGRTLDWLGTGNIKTVLLRRSATGLHLHGSSDVQRRRRRAGDEVRRVEDRSDARRRFDSRDRRHRQEIHRRHSLRRGTADASRTPARRFQVADRRRARAGRAVGAMSAELQARRLEYGRALAEFLENPEREEACLSAYDFGRRALASGVGLLELATLHHEVVASLLADAPTQSTAESLSTAKLFFIEALAPFEMSRRLVDEANATLRRLNETLEDGAKRIALSLHDEAGGIIAAARLQLDLAIQDSPNADAERFEEVRKLLDETGERLRHLSHELRPAILDDLGLGKALSFLAQGIEPLDDQSHRLRGTPRPPSREGRARALSSRAGGAEQRDPACERSLCNRRSPAREKK